jgi:hypothetical protein
MDWWQDIAFSPLNWYRSWPEEVPEDRAYVVDRIPRLVMRDCDYNFMAWPLDETPGICLLEWDIALDRRERAIFAEQALDRPDQVLVAPYWKSYGGAMQLVHRKNFGGGPTPVGSPGTDLFGFGCIYMPTSVLNEYLATAPDRFTDTTFSLWYRKAHGKGRVTWDIHPQHLHGD